MSAKERLRELAERKRLLVLEAELHRNFVALECQSLRARLAPLQVFSKYLGILKPWVLAGGAATGFAAAGRWRNVLRWISPALAVWRWLRQRKGA